jgi:dTDP-glucose 4,6-dehydratase
MARNISGSKNIGHSFLFTEDLHLIVNENSEALRSLDGKRILLFGGTGFIGKWLVGSLMQAKEDLNLEFDLNIVTRSIGSARKSLNLDGSEAIAFIEHDLGSSYLKEIEPHDVYIHGATPSVPKTGSLNQHSTINATRNATKSILESVIHSSGRPRVINLSSGAVLNGYGEQAPIIKEMSRLTPPLNHYSQAKIDAEKTLTDAAEADAIDLTNAHLFTFAGPYISLTDHFAVGNFMNDCMTKRQITVLGNPATTRSYMYPTDLISVLLRTIPKSDLGFLNVGSNIPITIADLASSFSKHFGGIPINFSGTSQPVSHYVPETNIQTNILNVHPRFDVETIISRWHSWINSNGLS